MSRNTDPAFFAAWTRQQLLDECIRLNKILKGIAEL